MEEYQNENKPIRKKKSGSALKQLFLTLLFLTLGLAMLVFVGDYMIERVVGDLTGGTGFSEALRGTGWMIVYGMGGLTVLMGLVWLLSSKTSK